MKQLQLPKMSTDKPSVPAKRSDNEACTNYLQQNFNQKASNLVWASDITYIKADGKWYYLCIVIDLYSRKIIAWHISANADVELVITAFQKAYKKRNAPYGLMFHSDREPSTQPLHFVSFWILLILCSLFLKKAIHLTMLAANASSNISRKKKQTANATILCKSFGSLFLNISKGTTIPKDHTAH